MAKFKWEPYQDEDGNWWKPSKNQRYRVQKIKCKGCNKDRFVRFCRITEDTYCRSCNLSKVRKEVKAFGFKGTYDHSYQIIRRKFAIKKNGNQCAKCKRKNLPIHCYCFHHTDPSTKSFNILGGYRRYDKWLEELDKTVMLCLNCHAIEHWGNNTLEPQRS